MVIFTYFIFIPTPSWRSRIILMSQQIATAAAAARVTRTKANFADFYEWAFEATSRELRDQR